MRIWMLVFLVGVVVTACDPLPEPRMPPLEFEPDPAAAEARDFGGPVMDMQLDGRLDAAPRDNGPSVPPDPPDALEPPDAPEPSADRTGLQPVVRTVPAPGRSLTVRGHLDAQSPRWARPNADCSAGHTRGQHFEGIVLRNRSEQMRQVRVHAEWRGDGFLHAYRWPFDAHDRALCVVGDDNFGQRSSRIEILDVPADGRRVIVASTFLPSDEIGPYTIRVETLGDDLPDADELDAGALDAGVPDAELPDAELPDAGQPDALPMCYACDPAFAADVPCAVAEPPPLAPQKVACRRPVQPSGEPALARQAIMDFNAWLNDPRYRIEREARQIVLTHRAPEGRDWERIQADFDADGRLAALILTREPMVTYTYRFHWRGEQPFLELREEEIEWWWHLRVAQTPGERGGWSSWSRLEDNDGEGESFMVVLGDDGSHERWEGSSNEGGESLYLRCRADGWLSHHSTSSGVAPGSIDGGGWRRNWVFVDGAYRLFYSSRWFNFGWNDEPMIWLDEARRRTHLRDRGDAITLYRRDAADVISHADVFECGVAPAERWCGNSLNLEPWEFDPPAEPERRPDRRICYTDACRIEVPCR